MAAILGRAVLALAALALAPPLSAQAAAERALVGLVFDSTVAGPMAGAAIYLVDSPHVTATDSLGRFALRGLPIGRHVLSLSHPRLDSLGLAVPPQWTVEVGEAVTRVTLAVPSLPTLFPERCRPPEDPTRSGVLAGIVRDASTGTPLPEAEVRLSWGSARRVLEADEQGRFMACGLPVATAIGVTAAFLDRSTDGVGVLLEPHRPRIETLELGIAAGAPARGRVVDAETGRGVGDAIVRVRTADSLVHRTVTDDDGRFVLAPLDLETYLLEVEHLAYGRQVRALAIADREAVELELSLSPDPLELEGLMVSVRFPDVERRAREGVRTDYVSREEIVALLGSAQDASDLVRDIPSLRVTRGVSQTTGLPTVCIQSRRARAAGPGGCDPVLVVLDGVVTDPEMLMAVPPDAIQSIEYLPALLAGVRYGARSGGGVLLVNTRVGGG